MQGVYSRLVEDPTGVAENIFCVYCDASGRKAHVVGPLSEASAFLTALGIECDAPDAVWPDSPYYDPSDVRFNAVEARENGGAEYRKVEGVHNTVKSLMAQEGAPSTHITVFSLSVFGHTLRGAGIGNLKRPRFRCARLALGVTAVAQCGPCKDAWQLKQAEFSATLQKLVQSLLVRRRRYQLLPR